MSRIRMNMIIVLVGVCSLSFLSAGESTSVWEYENSPTGVGWDLSMYEYLRPAFDDLDPGTGTLNSVEYARYVYLRSILAEPAGKAVKDLASVRRVTSLGDELSLEYQGENVRLGTFDFNVAMDLGIIDLSFSLSVDRGTIAQKGLSAAAFRKAAENGELALDVSYHLLHRKDNVYAVHFDSMDLYIESLPQSISSLEDVEGMEFTIEAIYTDVMISGLNTYALQPAVDVVGKYDARNPFGLLLSPADMSRRAAADIEQAWNAEEKRLDDLKIQEKKKAYEEKLKAYEEKLKARKREVEEFIRKYGVVDAALQEECEKNGIAYDEKVKEADQNPIVEICSSDVLMKNEINAVEGLESSSLSLGVYYLYPDSFGIAASVLTLFEKVPSAVEFSASAYDFLGGRPGFDLYCGVGAYLVPSDNQIVAISLGVDYDMHELKPLARLTWIPEIGGNRRLVHFYLEATPYDASMGIRFTVAEM